MVFKTVILSILLSLSLGFVSNATAAAPLCSGLQFSQSNKKDHYKYLARSLRDFEEDYRSFSQIAQSRNIFYYRIKSAFKSHGIAYSLKEHKVLFGFDTKQNERFLQVFSAENSKDFFFFGFESSRLKFLNDYGPGKEMATALNFFSKALMITNIIESAALQNKHTLKQIKNQWITSAKEVPKYNEQNDYKTLRLALEKKESELKEDSLYRVFHRAYRNQKLEMEKIIQDFYPELYKDLLAKLPKAIPINRLFHGLASNQLWKLQRGIGEVRNMKEPYRLATYDNKNHPVLPKVIKRTKAFYSQHPKAMEAIQSSQKLVEIADNGQLFPSPVFFKLMKFIASVPRDRSAKQKDDLPYFKMIQKVLEDKFNVKISIEQAETLKNYYQTVEAVIPKLIFTRTEPLLKSLDVDQYIISADRVNGSGLEMSLATKYLVLASNRLMHEKIRAPELGVNETTAILGKWSTKLSLILRDAFPGIKITDMRSGDDANFLLSRPPTSSEISQMKKSLEAYPEVRNSSRITKANYKAGTRLQESIEYLESIEKAIDKDFYHFKYHNVPELPRFSVERVSEKEIKLVLLEKASEEQIYFLNGIINDIQPQFKEKIQIDQ